MIMGGLNILLLRRGEGQGAGISHTTTIDSEPAGEGIAPQVNPTVTLSVDAKNGFNELGRKAMLWTVRHLWAKGSRFAFNCYRHSSLLVLRNPGNSCHLLASKEGITQGDPLSMLLYGVALVPLAKELRAHYPELCTPWYADDSSITGPADLVGAAMERLQLRGPARGYYPEPSKSTVVVADSDQERAREILAQFDFQYTTGTRHLGGFHGTAAARHKWLRPQVQKWTKGVHLLARVARKYPQTAYAGLTRSLQAEWLYLQRVLPDSGPALAPIEEAIVSDFLPALLQESPAECAKLRQRLALPVRHAGLGIPIPTSTADKAHQSSVDGTQVLTESLCYAETDFDVTEYLTACMKSRAGARKQAEEDHERKLTIQLAGLGAQVTRRALRSRETGAWLTTMPNLLNGTELSAEEFRDSLRLRYGLTPRALPRMCDACGVPFTVEHAMSCKRGGLITQRHDEVSAEWHQLCCNALQPSAVRYEPYIHAGSSTAQGGNQAAPAEVRQAIRGDVAAHGFWERGTTCIFDIRITDTDAPSYRGRDPAKVLATAEKEKKDKHLDGCLERRRHFTPLVLSVDGMRANEATAATKRLAVLLSKKWKRQYSELCSFIRSRLAIALARSTSRCLRGSRDPTARANSPFWDGGVGLTLYN